VSKDMGNTSGLPADDKVALIERGEEHRVPMSPDYTDLPADVRWSWRVIYGCGYAAMVILRSQLDFRR